MTFEIGGRVLIIFSDPGGAKPLLSYISLNKQIANFLVISDRIYDFYTDFHIPVLAYKSGMEIDTIASFKPDIVFTGTSYTSKLELRFIQEAKLRGILTYSFIDHYTSFVERFRLGTELIYPDNVCVIDQTALNIAVECAIPVPIIITGNFYHQFLTAWEPLLSKSAFLRQSGIDKSQKIIVFAPDPLRNVGGIEKFGLDEKSVLDEVLQVLSTFQRQDITLIVKAHPNQKEGVLDIKADGVNTMSAECFHTNTLLAHADLVIGIFSNILIEASILKTSVIRCLIGLNQPDPFNAIQVGSIARTRKELGALVKFNID